MKQFPTRAAKDIGRFIDLRLNTLPFLLLALVLTITIITLLRCRLLGLDPVVVLVEDRMQSIVYAREIGGLVAGP